MPKRRIEDGDPSHEYIMKKIKRLEKKMKKQRDRRAASRSSRSRSSRSRSSRSRSSRSRSPRSVSRHTPPHRPSTSTEMPPPPPPTAHPPLSPSPTHPRLSQPSDSQSSQQKIQITRPHETLPQTPQSSETQQPESQPLLPIPEPTQPETTPPATTGKPENKEEQLPTELLLALGHEGEEHNETGEPITNELAHRWTKIMREGLTKEQREALLEKNNIPSNFKAAIPPILNKEIAATLSELSLNRDKRIIARQKMTGKLITCLGKTLTEILKGNINIKNVTQEISDAAKIASDIYNNDNKSRKFFALSNATKPVQEACKDAKTDQYLFGEGLGEQIKSIQAVKRTAAQIKDHEKLPSTPKNLNWRGPPQYQSTSHRGRGGHRSTRRPPVTQHPRRPAPSRGRYAPRRGNQRRY